MIAAFLVVPYFVHDASFKESIPEFTEGLETSLTNEQIYELIKASLVVISVIGGILMIIGMLVLFLIILYNIYAGQLAYSVKVSEKNFPEIYKKVKEYTYLLGFRREPEVYVQQMNGMLNAYTSWIPGRTFIQLNAEIVDLAYMENKDFDTVFFAMAHEFGHIYLHHVQLNYTLWSNLIAFVPILGNLFFRPILSRAREYSADRVGQALTNGKNQEECMMLLSAGRHAYKKLNINDYMDKIAKPRGAMVRFFRWITNLLASHPIMPFRVAAILDVDKKSGRLL